MGGIQQKTDSGEGDVTIPSKLKEVIEESDDEYELFFEDTEGMIEMF
jgi:hypothetical protein